MRDSRYKVGIAATALWLLGIAVAVGWGWLGKKPDGMNEWGDFLAGLCSPIAFLWLILGYMQQGEELRQNTMALEAQLLELRQTVRVGRDQLEEVRLAAARDEAERRKTLRPIFTLRPGISSSGGAGVQQQVQLVNDGGLALNVVIETVGATMIAGQSHARIPKDSEVPLNILQQLPIPGLIRIHFEDAEGHDGEVEARFERLNAGLKFGVVRAVGATSESPRNS